MTVTRILAWMAVPAVTWLTPLNVFAKLVFQVLDVITKVLLLLLLLLLCLIKGHRNSFQLFNIIKTTFFRSMSWRCGGICRERHFPLAGDRDWPDCDTRLPLRNADHAGGEIEKTSSRDSDGPGNRHRIPGASGTHEIRPDNRIDCCEIMREIPGWHRRLELVWFVRVSRTKAGHRRREIHHTGKQFRRCQESDAYRCRTSGRRSGRLGRRRPNGSQSINTWLSWLKWIEFIIYSLY